jgi:hypothetical protein
VTGAAVANVRISILARSTTIEVATTTSDATGAYTSGPLAAGTYLLRASPIYASNYLNQVFPSIDCLRSSLQPLCDFSRGRAVTVQPGATTSGLDFPLELGGKIGGRVFTRDTRRPVGSARVSVFTDYGQSRSAVTLSDGTFSSLGLPRGSCFRRRQADL